MAEPKFGRSTTDCEQTKPSISLGASRNSKSVDFENNIHEVDRLGKHEIESGMKRLFHDSRVQPPFRGDEDQSVAPMYNSNKFCDVETGSHSRQFQAAYDDVGQMTTHVFGAFASTQSALHQASVLQELSCQQFGVRRIAIDTRIMFFMLQSYCILTNFDRDCRTVAQVANERRKKKKPLKIRGLVSV